ncbi:MAG TPA: helix-turn-helix domain-containing protein, partial [Streptosporangiaceae bacterium]|nr:helix-turn-helix domain-containing protein [Streptosporangiaceae bacterium]
MSIGEVLSDARCRSGLSIVEVSRQTGIREEVVWAVELDDFAKCGANLYARGYIRSIAAAVLVDPAPLLAEFDATHPAKQPSEPHGEASGEPGGERRPRPRGSRTTSELLALPEPYAPDTKHPLTRSQRYRRRHRRRVILSSAMCLAVLGIFGGEAYHFAHEGSNASENAAQAAFNRATTKPQPAKKPKPAASASHASHATPSPSATPTVQTLKPVSATAYGPWGVTGDNPQDAGQAIDGSTSTYWQSDWYSSASFGGLKTGTGLLIDFGKPVTIVSADLSLGDPGAYVELRGGDSSSPTVLKTIGGTKDAGDSTTIRPQETPVRYLLIWFTKLPQTSSGYQASLN